MTIKKFICLCLYYGIAKYLPNSYSPFLGKFSNAIRVFLVKRIFKKCGKIVTIGRGVTFGKGDELEIGDDSGFGPYNTVPPNIKIGNHVMMAPEILILKNNHRCDLPDMPIGWQGYVDVGPVVIEDNVWIGQRAIILPGRRIATGTVVGAGAVVTHDTEPDTIVGGNPARKVRDRIVKKG